MMSRLLLVIPLLLTTGGHAAAQAGPAPPPSTPPVSTVVGVDQNARETRDRLRDILGQYPASLALVLQLDPTLLARQDYLAPYPTLASYLAQHPEVAHNPTYFLGDQIGPGGFRRFNVSTGGSESPRAQIPGALAPISRILWSLQTGIVVAVGGVGLLISNGRLIEELAQPLYLVATLAIAVGIGFVISAVVAFALSRHLGLLQADSTHA